MNFVYYIYIYDCMWLCSVPCLLAYLPIHLFICVLMCKWFVYAPHLLIALIICLYSSTHICVYLLVLMYALLCVDLSSYDFPCFFVYLLICFSSTRTCLGLKVKRLFLGGGFKYCLFSFDFWLIFFKRVETTKMILLEFGLTPDLRLAIGRYGSKLAHFWSYHCVHYIGSMSIGQASPPWN